MSNADGSIEQQMKASLSKAAGTPIAPIATPPIAPIATPSIAPPVSAPGVVQIGNIAAALNPSAHKQAATQVVVNDTFPYDVAFNMAFLGSGQGGARLASSFWSLGYRRVALFNTAESDFQGLPEEIHMKRKSGICCNAHGATMWTMV